MRLRIACLQFDPALGRVDANVAKVHHMMSKFTKEIDLLVLPELAITGYNFSSAKDIEPFLEKSGEGVSFTLASQLSRKYKCTTVIGYPEKHGVTRYNSALVVNSLGKLVTNYRKSHLYETDETWGCTENPVRGFPPLRLTWPNEVSTKSRSFSNLSDPSNPSIPVSGLNRGSVRTNIGICMDLNPYQFKAPFNEFEFSMSCWQNNASLVIVPTAWLSSDSPSIQEMLNDAEKQESAKILQKKRFENAATPSQSTLDYWILRLFPFLVHPYNGLPKKDHRTTVVICNRTGIEDTVMYDGTSCIMQFDPSKGGSNAVDASNPSVDVLASAGWASEEIIYREVDL